MRSLLVFSLLLPEVLAQSNTIAGLQGRLTNNASPTYFGRRGTHPDGEVGMSYSYSMCNPGTVPMAWTAPMNPSHPMFAYMVVRESNGRLEQITNATTTYCKHAFGAANTSSTCGTCSTTGTGLRVGCNDTYGASTNANRFYLGPSSEIDPWTGIWNPIGSYFDRGDPAVAGPADSDGVRSLTSGTTGVFTDPVRNRVTLREQDLLAPGRLFHCMHIVVRGEDGDFHFDNIAHREFTATWNATASTWAFANPVAGVPFTQGTVLDRWTGATVHTARNGDDDGHFFVATKVTALGGGLHHYEYIVQNFDNARGAASLRIPVCPSTQVTNVTFRDVDGDALNDWTWTRVGDELVFLASATNPLDWNTMFNFAFDCDQAPVAGAALVDQARVGPGALTLAIAAAIPGGVAAVASIGAGCGAPQPALLPQGLPTIPNAGFGLQLATSPGAALLLFFAPAPASLPLAPGCTQYLDGTSLAEYGLFFADGAGIANVPVPVPADLAFDGLTLFWQAAQFVPGGPVLGSFTVSNGLSTRAGCR